MAQLFPSIGTQFADRAARHPEAPAITCAGRTLSFRELDAAANRLARAYANLGVAQGHLVTIGLPNGIEFVTAALATWKLGATPQPVSHLLPRRERMAIVELARPTLVVGVAESLAGVASVPPGFVADAQLSDAPHPDRLSAPWKVMTSGGSTGRPKLIVAAGDSALDPKSATDLFKLKDRGVALVPGPLYHNTPFQTTVTALLAGNHVVMLERFDALQTLEAIKTHRVDVLSLVPTMMQRILRLIDETGYQPDFSSIRVLWHMAAPCPPWLKRRWLDLVGPDRLWEIYGGTELISVTCIQGTEWLQHPGSVGRPLFGDMRVLDDQGNEVPRGTVGEIYMQPPAGAKLFRYIGAEAKTRGDWTTLGDMGWMDADGYLFISDRRTDMIVAGGANVYPAEVEAAILEHPGVLSAVVVGLPHEDLGQVPHAVVQAQSGVTEADLRQHLAERLVRYKTPRSYHLVTQHLRDDAGKVRRTAIREEEIRRLGLKP